MYKVHVLFNGFSRLSENGKEMYANCTCSLIKGPKNIIIDTMTAWDKDKILEGLSSFDLSPKDVDIVVSTHGHSDHIGNNNLFLNATHIVGQSISRGETYILHNFEEDYIVDDHIRVMATPGHTMSCVSIIVRADIGAASIATVAIVGDLFEKEEDLVNENIWIEAGSENVEMQRRNRDKILKIADYIIPGHGPMFKVVR